MITDADIQKLAKVFATKDDLSEMRTEIKGIKKDLNRFATKDDLSEMRTEIKGIKKDLNRFATKDDLNRFATKDDLNRFATKDDLNRFATKEDVYDIVRESTDGIVEGVKTIIEMLGETSKKTEQNTQELQTVCIAIGDHEERICKLEHASA